MMDNYNEEVKREIKDMSFDDDILLHYGIKRRSGRYPWGSGENPYQHEGSFTSRLNGIRQAHPEWSEKQIADSLNMTIAEVRNYKGIDTDKMRMVKIEQAEALRDKGLSIREAAKEMGVAASTYQSYLDPGRKARTMASMETYNYLKGQIEKHGMIDVGKDAHRLIGVSKVKFDQALEMLDIDGYNIYPISAPQINRPGQVNRMLVATKPETPYKDAYNYSEIKPVTELVSIDNGNSFKSRSLQPPTPVDPNRVSVKYREDGGGKSDGLILIRPSAADLSLGNSAYAQVRIQVGKDRYLKGMAAYGDEKDFPEGVDLIFNTNKSNTTSARDAMKKTEPLTNGNVNPFGSYIDPIKGQYTYTDPSTGTEKLSPINKTNDEGAWHEWNRELSSQFLAKQNVPLINRQIKVALDRKESELREIQNLTNPTVKKKLLADYANKTDADAVNLQAAGLPNAKYQVILPVNSLKDNEVYAPNYTDGTQLALVRFPHAGTFEIPVVTVNNSNREGNRLIGKQAADAIGINSNVAQQLSGADFDGDSVLVIPNTSRTKISARKPLPGLQDFDPQINYAGTPKLDKNGNPQTDSEGNIKYSHPIMSPKNKQKQMGIASNLITDMTVQGATDPELERAVKHSMVVIDAEKHKLDYRRSERENNIQELKNKYQPKAEGGKAGGGAATILSRAKSEQRVPSRYETTPDPKTGRKQYVETPKTYTDKDGNEKERTIKSTRMYETEDARTLLSSNPDVKEVIYADYANALKALGNTARKDYVNTTENRRSPNAAETYKNEVDSLEQKLLKSKMNTPKERQAHTIANGRVKAIIAADSDNLYDDSDARKKLNQQQLEQARAEVGAKRTPINITPNEWDAIQANAISKTKLSEILKYADMDQVTAYSMPRSSKALTTGQLNRARNMKNNGYTNADIASAFGVSVSTLVKLLEGE